VGAVLPLVIGPSLTDDTYIAIRYADNLAHGHGLVWNVGDRATIPAAPGRVLVLALLIKLGPRATRAAYFLGVAGAVASSAMAGLLAASLVGGFEGWKGRAAWIAAAVLVAVFPPLVSDSVAGGAGAICSALVLGAVALVRYGRPLASLVVGGAACLFIPSGLSGSLMPSAGVFQEIRHQGDEGRRLTAFASGLDIGPGQSVLAMQPGAIACATGVLVLDARGNLTPGVQSGEPVRPARLQVAYGISPTQVLEQKPDWVVSAEAFLRPDADGKGCATDGTVLQDYSVAAWDRTAHPFGGEGLVALKRSRKRTSLDGDWQAFHAAVRQNNFGLEAFGERRFQEAADHFRRARGMDPNFAEAAANYGVILCAAGAVVAAKAEFQEATRLSPDSQAVALAYGTCLENDARYAEALEVYKAALRQSASMPEVLLRVRRLEKKD